MFRREVKRKPILEVIQRFVDANWRGLFFLDLETEGNVLDINNEES